MPDFMSKLVLVLIVVSGLSACGEQKAKTEVKHDPVAIESGEECHLCGMVISKFPGPKGELYDSNGKVNKFCSTRDLFAWYLQPENQIASREIFVHDMVQTPWDKPNDKHLVNARDAWYVVGSDMKGAMGPTLASFKNKADAEIFAKKHGGDLLTFKDITLDLLNKMMADSNNMPADSASSGAMSGMKM